jgi:hypothetical protein
MFFVVPRFTKSANAGQVTIVKLSYEIFVDHEAFAASFAVQKSKRFYPTLLMRNLA